MTFSFLLILLLKFLSGFSFSDRLSICNDISDDFRTRHRSGPNDFTRRRALPFDQLIYLLASIPSASYETELRRFNKENTGQDIAGPQATKGALTRARQKLKPDAFIELNDVLVRRYEWGFLPILWNGFRLLAIDDTLATVPYIEVIARFFGVWNGPHGDPCPKARVSQLFDVINGITIDAIISPMSQGERELAASHCLKLMKNDLLLLDRGYEGFWLLKLIRTVGAHACARVSCGKLAIVKKFVASGKREEIVTFRSARDSAKKCAEPGIDQRPIRIRLIRVDLPSGETEVLMTSLNDRSRYPIEHFADLYHQRWSVEEDYKVMKCRIQIENFTGKTVHSVFQDFHAKVFSKNLTAIFIQSVQRAVESVNERRRRVYKVNFINALATMKQHFVVLFTRCNDMPDKNGAQIQDIIARSLNKVETGTPCRDNSKEQAAEISLGLQVGLLSQRH